MIRWRTKCPNWNVSDISLSYTDTYYYQMGDQEVIRVTYQIPKRTNWESHWEDLKVNPGAAQRLVHSVQYVDLTVDTEQQAILSYNHHKRPVRVALSPRGVSW